MTKNKRYIDGGEECVEDQFLIDTETDESFFIDHGLDKIIGRLNEQEERIRELEKENEQLKKAAKEFTQNTTQHNLWRLRTVLKDSGVE